VTYGIVSYCFMVQGGTKMKKILNAAVVLATVLTLASPAAAQLSGFVSLDGSPTGPSFGARVGLDYALSLSDAASVTVGARYNLNVIGNPVAPSSATVFARLDNLLSDSLNVGGQVTVAVSGIGASNAVGLSLRPYVAYRFFANESFAAVATLNLETAIVPTFTFTPFVQVDTIYISGPLTVYFGAEADFTVTPGFSFDALFGYLNINYTLSDVLELRAGAGFGYAAGNFGLVGGIFDSDSSGLYAGLQYTLNDSFKLRLTGGYTGSIYITLTGFFNL
jgi:hypothetical protein